MTGDPSARLAIAAGVAGLVVGVALSGIAGLAFRHFVVEKEEARLLYGRTPEVIAVATHDLEPGTALGPADVEAITVASYAVSRDVVSGLRMGELTGKRLLVPIGKGSPLWWSLIDPLAAPPAVDPASRAACEEELRARGLLETEHTVGEVRGRLMIRGRAP